MEICDSSISDRINPSLKNFDCTFETLAEKETSQVLGKMQPVLKKGAYRSTVSEKRELLDKQVILKNFCYYNLLY